MIEQLAQQSKRILSLNNLVEEQAEQLRLKRHQQYGASSEKVDPNQQPELFDEAEDTLIESIEADVAQGFDDDAISTDANDADTKNEAPRTQNRGRKALSAHVERRCTELDVRAVVKKLKSVKNLAKNSTSFRR